MNIYKKSNITTFNKENILDIIGSVQNAYTALITVEVWRGAVSQLDSNKTAEIKMASLDPSEKIYTARV